MDKPDLERVIGHAYWMATNPPYYSSERLLEYLELGGDPNAARDQLSCLPHWVGLHGTNEDLYALITAGGEVDCRSAWGHTPLFWIYYECALQNVIPHDRVEALLERGANINATEQDGDTPLHKLTTSLYPRPDEVAFLVRHGAKVGPRNKKGRQPIHNAAEMCQPLTAAKLVELGAEINAQDSDGLTPLHIIGKGISVWHWPEARLSAAVTGLLDLGASPNIKNKSGQTVLTHYLGRFGDMGSIFKTLLEHGADPTLADKDELTPSQHALSHGHREVAEMFAVQWQALNA